MRTEGGEQRWRWMSGENEWKWWKKRIIGLESRSVVDLSDAATQFPEETGGIDGGRNNQSLASEGKK